MKHFRDLVLSTKEPKFHNVLWIKPLPNSKGSYRIYMYEDGWVPLYGGGDSGDLPIQDILYWAIYADRVQLYDAAADNKSIYPTTKIDYVIDNNTGATLGSILAQLRTQIYNAMNLGTMYNPKSAITIIGGINYPNTSLLDTFTQIKATIPFSTGDFCVFVDTGLTYPVMANKGVLVSNSTTAVELNITKLTSYISQYVIEWNPSTESWEKKEHKSIRIPIAVYPGNADNFYIYLTVEDVDNLVFPEFSYNDIELNIQNGDLNLSVRTPVTNVEVGTKMEEATGTRLFLKLYTLNGDVFWALLYRFEEGADAPRDITTLLHTGDIITSYTGEEYVIDRGYTRTYVIDLDNSSQGPQGRMVIGIKEQATKADVAAVKPFNIYVIDNKNTMPISKYDPYTYDLLNEINTKYYIERPIANLGELDLTTLTLKFDLNLDGVVDVGDVNLLNPALQLNKDEYADYVTLHFNQRVRYGETKIETFYRILDLNSDGYVDIGDLLALLEFIDGQITAENASQFMSTHHIPRAGIAPTGNLVGTILAQDHLVVNRYLVKVTNTSASKVLLEKNDLVIFNGNTYKVIAVSNLSYAELEKVSGTKTYKATEVSSKPTTGSIGYYLVINDSSHTEDWYSLFYIDSDGEVEDVTYLTHTGDLIIVDDKMYGIKQKAVYNDTWNYRITLV